MPGTMKTLSRAITNLTRTEVVKLMQVSLMPLLRDLPIFELDLNYPLSHDKANVKLDYKSTILVFCTKLFAIQTIDFIAFLPY